LISRENFPYENGPDEDDSDDLLDDPDESSAPDDSENETHQGGGKRGRVTELSECARRRLRETVHAVDRDVQILFLTLTWNEVMPGPREAKKAIGRFGKRFSNHFPSASFIWKLEPQERGFPHFHLFTYGLPWVDPQKISAMWHGCTDEVSDAHRKSGVDVEWVEDDDKVQAYLAKYFSKADGDFGNEEEPWDWTGRFWGVCNRPALPVMPWANWKVHISQSDAVELITALLDEWDVDIPAGIVPPSLLINCRGAAGDRLDRLLDRLEE